MQLAASAGVHYLGIIECLNPPCAGANDFMTVIKLLCHVFPCEFAHVGLYVVLIYITGHVICYCYFFGVYEHLVFDSRNIEHGT